MSVEISIDRDTCIGSGNCGFLAPRVFDVDDDGSAYVLDPDGADLDTIETAARNCPTRSITVRLT